MVECPPYTGKVGWFDSPSAYHQFKIRDWIMKFMLIAGTRPNFMKIASIIKAIDNYNQSPDGLDTTVSRLLVHTGQHYDEAMSKSFFNDLSIPKPDINLEVGSLSHAEQTAKIMKRFESVVLREQPDVVVVVGDVNSTIACALVASKIVYPVSSNRNRPLIAHVEAGLRSFDREMPEEINRILTDAISDFLFTTEESAGENLRREGIPEENIFFVGNTMIDTLLKHYEKAKQSNALSHFGLAKGLSTDYCQLTTDYCVLTLHRPSNVDNKEVFIDIIEALSAIAKQIPIIFPVHPRTLNRIKEFGLEKYFVFQGHNSQLTTHNSQINYINPLGYLDFLCLMSNAKLVLTDSGGMQEETTVLGIPCVTLRKNTERPVTVTHGTNLVVGIEKENILNAALSQLEKSKTEKLTKNPKLTVPPLWDGKSGKRIIDVLVSKTKRADQP